MACSASLRDCSTVLLCLVVGWVGVGSGIDMQKLVVRGATDFAGAWE